MNTRADSVRVAHPLFQAEGGGSTPTSALQLQVFGCPIRDAVRLNRKWHSRLPVLSNWQACEAYSAEFEGVRYAVAIWSHPVARLLNGKGMWELRRMAIAPDAPRNTASRMLSVMSRLIRKARPDIATLISYQDTDVHKGTIYKASGWSPRLMSDSQTKWSMPNREREDGPASNSPKVRWELIIKPH